MNVFEGSRRLAYAVMSLVVVAVLFYTTTYKPYIYMNYSISSPNADFIRTSSDCPSDAGKAFFSTTTKSGIPVSINLCMTTLEFGENNDLLVPYKVDSDGMIWGAKSYSNLISNYEKELEQKFSLSEEDEKWVEKENRSQYIANWKDSMKFLIIGLILFYLLISGIGWIIRGFMGIQHNKDKK